VISSFQVVEVWLGMNERKADITALLPESNISQFWLITQIKKSLQLSFEMFMCMNDRGVTASLDHGGILVSGIGIQ